MKQYDENFHRQVKFDLILVDWNVLISYDLQVTFKNSAMRYPEN